MNTKGQLGTLQTIIITLVVVGILLGVGLMLLENFTKQIDNEVATVTNETITAITNLSSTGKYATKNYTTTGIDCYNTFAVTVMHNATDGAVIPTSNYTYDANGKVWVVEPTGYNDKNVNITYTYKYGNEACAGVETTISATSEIPTWLPIIVILAIVGILLAIVFRVLPSGGREGSMTAEI